MGRFKGATCFLLMPIARVKLRLRRYVHADHCVKGYHNAEVTIGEEEQTLDEERTHGDLHDHADPRWPNKCEHCNYVFRDEDHWQLNPDRMFKSSNGRKPMTIHEAPPGAMWYADWMPHTKGPDGRCLIVRCPNGYDWTIDGRASNCTRPDDKKHNCWYREGEPPNVTIIHPHPKSCSAGAGSIGIGEGENNYHGFLRNGKLSDG